MKIEVIPVEVKDKSVLRQLIELYSHDFSEYTKEDVNEHGFYDYPYFDYYWTDESRHPFFIKVDGSFAGFVLVKNTIDEKARTIAELFVMRKYRRAKVGKIAAKQIFSLFKGEWVVKVLNVNAGALPFWRKVIDEYTGGNFCYHPEPTDDWDGVYYTFNSGAVI